MKELLKRIITSFINRDLGNYWEREVKLPQQPPSITTVSGARRTGKTTLLLSLAVELRKELAATSIVYLNLEDDRLFPASLETLQIFEQAYYELFPGKNSEKVYFLFDEIQVVKNWELFVNRLHEQDQCFVYVTGSSSKMLSKEISTSLRGRTINFELFPLSFSEFLQVKKINYQPYSDPSINQVKNAFYDYLNSTSMPEILSYSKELRINSLQRYFDLVMYRDILERHNISNQYALKYFVKFLLQNIGNKISIRKIHNHFKSQQVKVALNTLYNFLEYLSDAYAFYPVYLFTENLREQQRNPFKIYTLDHGLKVAYTGTKDTGRLLENIVFMHLRRKLPELYYWQNKQEVDFIWRDENGQVHLLNVASNVDDINTFEREIEGLKEGMTFFSVSEAILITMDMEKELDLSKNRSISIRPFWKWAME